MSGKNYNRIKELLAREGKTNLELANYLDVHIQTVSGWCTNSNQPKFSTLFQISEFLQTEAGDLLTLKKDLKPLKKEGTVKKSKIKKKAK